MPLQNVVIRHSTGHVSYTGGEGLFGIVSDKPVDTLVFSLDGYVRQSFGARSGEHNNVVLKRSAARANNYTLSSLTVDLKKQLQQNWLNGEETYTSLVENRFLPANLHPKTALSLNIDRASYSNIRRFINTKMFVPPDAVRIEEMLNYFQFNYRVPRSGEDFTID